MAGLFAFCARSENVDDETTQVVGTEQTASQEAAADEQEAPDVAELLKEIKNLRRENAKWRTQLRDVESQKQEQAKAEMSETERLKAELREAQEARTRAEQARLETSIRSQVIAAAAKAGFNDPEDAYRMLDQSALDVDDSGTVDGLEKALKSLLVNKPYLAKPAGAFSPTNPASGAGKPSDDQILAEIYGSRKSNIFAGGGVFSANQPE